MKVIAIIQARMGSKRLPGKVMKKIIGIPVLIHDLERIGRMKTIDKIVVATTLLSEDDVIVNTVKNYSENIGIYRGSENNVLNRYYKAAKEFKADVIVRITSDCPLIDPNISDLVVEKYSDGRCDYCSNNLLKTYPHGLDTEVFSFEALEKAEKESKDSYEKEHVTLYIINNPDKFRLLNVKNDKNLRDLRWTLDYPEDLTLIKEIYNKLYHQNGFFWMHDILKLLENEPDLVEINKKYLVN